MNRSTVVSTSEAEEELAVRADRLVQVTAVTRWLP
jgi:hypothetical protein